MSEKYTTVSEFQSYLTSVGDWGQVVAIPDAHCKVWKDECLFCFCDSECIEGLCINMKTFQGFCSKHVALDLKKTPRSLYLVEKSSKVCTPNHGGSQGLFIYCDIIAVDS